MEMEKAAVNGVELVFDVIGSGEPVLLISTGPIADSFQPLVREPILAEGYQLITYHQRGQGGAARSATPVSFEAHADDAAELLRHLGIGRAHVAGHSTGAAIALQLAVVRPEMVHTLILFEPPLLCVPSSSSFFEKAEPALAAYGAGDRGDAMTRFLSTVSGLPWESCRKVVDEQIPGGVAQVMKDADNFFRSYLPALQAWAFGPEQAAAISQPVLSVLGTETEELFVEGSKLLHSWFPQLEDYVLADAGHLLHLQRPQPLAEAVAEFLGRYPMVES